MYSDEYKPAYTTRTSENVCGVFCGFCRAKTYLSQDGSHRRCPNCDDK